jgi:hypothetical protein
MSFKVTLGRRDSSGLVRWRLAARLVAASAWLLPQAAGAASLSVKDLLVLGRAVAFMQPPPGPDAFVGVVYSPGNAASRQDAEAILVTLGAGLHAGKAILRPKLVDIAAVAAGGFQVVIAAAGSTGPELTAAVRQSRTLCVTTDIEAVKAALCTMAIMSEPRVEIVVNHAVSAAAGIEFAAAFRMMIREM